MKFIPKLIRNTFILGLAYFISNFMLFEDFSYDEFKSLIVFAGLYLTAELMHHYNISYTASPKVRKAKKGALTLFF